MINLILKDELHDIEELFYAWGAQSNDIALGETFHLESQKLYQAWKMVSFSEISDQSLRRYFHYQLEGILKISDTLCSMSNTELSTTKHHHLLSLIDHLIQYFPNYFNQNAIAPIAYHKRAVEEWNANVQLLNIKIESAEIDYEFKTLFCGWVKKLSEINYSRRYSFREISYSKYVIKEMLLTDVLSDGAEENLISFLSSANFNHLAFFVYRQNKIRSEVEAIISSGDKIKYLANQKTIILSFPETKSIAFNVSWPSVKTMLGDWLQEEILLAEKFLNKESEVVVPKIPLEMSVAHLSCLIRLLYEESVFATQNLQFIFKGFAGYFRSKRQAVISPGSLSKEFYSIDQHTAARVRDLLQRMVQRINRNFFPMVVAINAIALSYLSMR